MKKCESVTKLSNNAIIDLDSFSAEDLYRLHYEEECFAAEKMRKLPPLSAQRGQYLNNAYKLIRKIKHVRAIKEFGTPQETFGASKGSVDILLRLISKKSRKANRKTPCFMKQVLASDLLLMQFLMHMETQFCN